MLDAIPSRQAVAAYVEHPIQAAVQVYLERCPVKRCRGVVPDVVGNCGPADQTVILAGCRLAGAFLIVGG